jgi:MerR family transcriptional regulator, light-induced transcriptional regulator
MDACPSQNWYKLTLYKILMMTLEEQPTPYSIGDLAKLSGISTLCIRAWETRHGFPMAVRLPSGHRRYSKVDLLRLQLIAQAQERGHRIGKLSKCSIAELRVLIDEQDGPKGEAPLINDARFSQLIANIKDGHFDLLHQELSTQHENMELVDFLGKFVHPLLEIIGRHWMEGEINIAYEHQATLDVAYFLQNLWRNQQENLSGEEWVIAGLTGDHHSIAQHMVACLLSEAGKKVVYLGPRTPAADLIDFMKDRQAKALCISVSISTSAPIIEEDLATIHAFTEEHDIRLEVGGAGAVSSRFCTNDSLYAFAESLKQA